MDREIGVSEMTPEPMPYVADIFSKTAGTGAAAVQWLFIFVGYTVQNIVLFCHT